MLVRSIVSTWNNYTKNKVFTEIDCFSIVKSTDVGTTCQHLSGSRSYLFIGYRLKMHVTNFVPIMHCSKKMNVGTA